jgi:hypothetical protein
LDGCETGVEESTWIAQEIETNLQGQHDGWANNLYQKITLILQAPMQMENG